MKLRREKYAPEVAISTPFYLGLDGIRSELGKLKMKLLRPN